MFVVGILAISNDKGIQNLAPENEFWTLLVTSRERPAPWHLSSSIPQVSQVHWGRPGVQLPSTSLCAHSFPMPRLLSSLLAGIAPVHSSNLRSGVTFPGNLEGSVSPSCPGQRWSEHITVDVGKRSALPAPTPLGVKWE